MNQQRKGEVTIAVVVLIVLLSLATAQFVSDVNKYSDNNESVMGDY